MHTGAPRGDCLTAALYGSGLVRRLVGTRNVFPSDQRTSNGTNTAFNSRRYCYTPVPIVNPSVVYAGFRFGNGESDMPNAVTYGTELELPDGTLRAFTKGGNVTQTVASGTIFDESDQIAGFTIPAGGYYIKCYGTVTGGQTYSYTDIFRNTTYGTVMEEGVGTASRLGTAGTFTSASQYIAGPVGIMGSVPVGHRSFAIPGDSLSVGVGGFILTMTGGALGVGYGGDIGYIAGHLAGKASYAHYGASGYSAVTAKTGMTRRNQFMASANHTDLVCNLGTNDGYSGNRSAAAIETDLEACYASWIAAAPGISRRYQATITPASDVTGPPSSDVNQAGRTNVLDGRMQTLNTSIRALGVAGTTGYIEAAIPVENTLNPLWWKANYTTDGLHPLQVGGEAMVTALNSANPMGF